MHLILIAWLYVTLMMAIAEAANPVGSVLGGIVTFVLYGLLPMGIVAYILDTPARKRRLQARRAKAQSDWEAAQQAAATAGDPGAARADVGPDAGSDLRPPAAPATTATAATAAAQSDTR